MATVYRYRCVLLLMILITGCVIFFSQSYYLKSNQILIATIATFWVKLKNSNSSDSKNNHGLTSQHQHKTNNISFSSMVGSVNYDEWLCGPFVGYLVDDLRIHHHQWPNHPTNKRTASSVHVYHEKILHMGAKVYGYILPPITGSYQFRILQKSKNKAAVSGELWISTDSNPMNMIKQTVFTYSIKDVESKSHNDQSSKAVSVDLYDDQNYYFEFHAKGHKGKIDILVEWKLPQSNTFQSIPSSYLSLAFNKNESNSDPLLSNNLPSNRLQSIGFTKHISYNVTKITDLNILPECKLGKHSTIPLFTIKSESSMYPPDTNKPFSARRIWPANYYVNNNEIPIKRVDIINQLYKKQFDKQKNFKGKVLGVHYLEETYNEGYGGSRFLLEMDVQLQNAIVRTSEYVYLPKDGSELCHTTNFQWKRNVHVTLVITIKNIGQWVDHLIYNLEDIYHETKDENFTLVVVDFNSTDKDIEGALKKSSLPKWKYISLEGKFSRTLGLQTGIDYVKDDNSIVMSIDLHLNLPPNFIEYTRKHTIQGKMAYSPMFFRLDEGYTANNPSGFWEFLTFGLFSLYKSDWKALGGWNTVKYKYNWGGEDYDIYLRTMSSNYDFHRSRPPGLFHYFHTRDGLWSTNITSDKFNC